MRGSFGNGGATNAKYTVNHAGGSSVVTESQAQRGGQWNELGTFAFAGGQDYAVTLSDDANGIVVADALYIVKVEELTDAVTWVSNLPASGSYQVCAKWTADETRATDARYSIMHSGGTAEVSVNQRAAGGLRQYLGSYAFEALNTAAGHDRFCGKLRLGKLPVWFTCPKNDPMLIAPPAAPAGSPSSPSSGS